MQSQARPGRQGFPKTNRLGTLIALIGIAGQGKPTSSSSQAVQAAHQAAIHDHTPANPRTDDYIHHTLAAAPCTKPVFG